jgi:hypothetical protein
MKKIVLLSSLVVLALSLSAARPATTAGPSKEEKQLRSAATATDKEASEPEGQKTVVSRLESTFNVDQARIDGLRAQNLGYGEIAIVLALAQKMADGITDANVQSIMSLRTGTPPMGWGEIARQLGEKLGPVISSVNAVAKGSTGADRAAHDARGAKPDRPEKPAKPDRPDKPENPGRP